ncbi:hypothetical protein LIA77_04834 [Sarocladium implicatum]|nr:hypothetical protein LIA77_04834 [Sarocladium implicatum]
MDRLSAEILDEILAYMFEDSSGEDSSSDDNSSQGKLARYATVCRRWQKVIEMKTMRSIDLDTKDIEDFSRIFTSSIFAHRRHALRRLSVTIGMPATTKTLEEGCRENNIYFRDKTVRLLRELASWEKHTNEDDIEARCNSSLRLTLCWGETGDYSSPPPLRDAFLNFPKAEDVLGLPTVNLVTQLCIKPDSTRPTHPAALCHIISRMPRLRKVTLGLRAPSRGNIALRLEHHRSLAQGVEGFLHQIPRLSALEIDISDMGIMNHSVEQPDFTENGVDRLSTAIRRIGEAGRLRSLSLRFVPVSLDLFCERGDATLDQAKESEAGRGKLWPSIQKVLIRSELATADGQWMFTGDPNALYVHPGHSSDTSVASREGSGMYESDSEGSYSDDSDSEESSQEDHSSRPTPDEEIWNQWRLAPEPTVFDPLLETIARTATRQMPAIQGFDFHTWDCFSNWVTHLPVQNIFGGTQTTVALKMADAGELFEYDFDGPWGWLSNDLGSH